MLTQSNSPKKDEARAALARDVEAFLAKEGANSIQRFDSFARRLDLVSLNDVRAPSMALAHVHRPGRPPKWPPEKLQQLRERWDHASLEELVKEFKCSASSIKRKGYEIGLVINGGRGIKWTPEKLKLLREQWGKTPAKVLAVHCGCSFSVVNKKAAELGLTKKIRKVTK